MMVQAGSLSAQYRDGSLRYIRFGDREVLRQVYMALRDRNWKTVPARISGEAVENGSDYFKIQFEAEHQSEEVHFVWSGTITGERDGSIRWTMSGEPRQPFLRNRIGFCVLHPIEGCAGHRCIVEHTDGSREETIFPRTISPHQPFLDVQAISHEIAPGLLAEVRFGGDLFETEDHRNWTDDSFKTYSTPLALLYPVRVSPGERVGQSVALTLVKTGQTVVTITVDRTGLKPMPALGLLLDKTESPLTGVSHIRTDLHLAGQTWRDELAHAAALGFALEIALFTDHPQQDLAGFAPPEGVRRWLVFTADGTVTKPEAVAWVKQMLGPGATVGGGSNTNFAELNRNRDVVDVLDFVSWAIHPQRHATDEDTTIENLEGQRATAETARTFAGDRPLSVSPVHVPPIAAVDSWIAASISQLGNAEVQSITYDTPSPLFGEIGQFAPNQIAAVQSSDPLRASALALLSQGQMRVWLANFREEVVDVQFENRKLRLRPFELRSLDWEGD
ncbi:MAG: hypothetical protein JOY85_06265 [Acidobacteriaceae bacterium]|nr:hypothetical protein [Acidobacteriaceae bacterium]